MRHAIAPIACKPWSLNGISERLIASHYEHHYGAAVRSLNAIRDELAILDLVTAPEHRIRAIKREELSALGSVHLHELYFGTLGGDGATLFTGSGPGTRIEAPVATALERQFGSVAAWRREFMALARALSHGSGWALLMYSRQDGRLYNQLADDHAHAMIDAVPVLALDMFEHAYQLDFAANVSAYVDAFMRNIDWSAVGNRLMEASGNCVRAGPQVADETLPSVSVEELSVELAKREQIQVVDTRPKHYFSRTSDMMPGAMWRDPDLIDEWSGELSPDVPVFVYCAYGYAVGCGVTAVLRERGFDAKYIRGGLAAWYAAGGERVLKPRSNA
jgi:Fe-Mn family superoxide dismutase